MTVLQGKEIHWNNCNGFATTQICNQNATVKVCNKVATNLDQYAFAIDLQQRANIAKIQIFQQSCNVINLQRLTESDFANK